MAKVLILSARPHPPFDVWVHSSAFLLEHSAGIDTFGKHHLTDDPDEADIILFAEMGTCGKFAELVRAHPHYRRYAEKCFLFDSADLYFPIVPGIYASLTKDHHRLGYVRTGFYLYLIENAFINHRPYSGNEKYLASFVGAKRSHPVREKLFALRHKDIYIKDTSNYGAQITYHGQPAERAAFWQEYADTMADARFSLCPRGRGAGSIRLFESMKMGRACVIISDAWQPGDGVNWDEFSITVPECEAGQLPEILERYADRAAEMGARARQVWLEHYSEQVRFHRIVELCLDIQKQVGNSIVKRWLRTLKQTTNPKNLRWYLNSKKNLYLDFRKIYL